MIVQINDADTTSGSRFVLNEAGHLSGEYSAISLLYQNYL